jgi:regulator of RNase E activity RraA
VWACVRCCVRAWVHAQVIAVDNVLVRPGDYILADDDGVVVIPMGVAPKIAELAIEYGATTLDS